MSILAEDVASFAGKADSLEEFQGHTSGKSGSRTNTTAKSKQCVAFVRLESLLDQGTNKVDENESDEEEIAQSMLLRFGPLQGSYLMDFTADRGSSANLKRPVAYLLESCQKIGRIDGIGFIHYDTELETTEQQILKNQNHPRTSKELLNSINGSNEL